MNRPLGLLVLAAAAAALIGCGSSETTPAPAAAPTSQALSPKETAFLAELAKIAPPLADVPDRAVRRAANTCSDLATRGVANEQTIRNAVDRFSGGTYTVTSDQARKIVEAARVTVCAS